MATRTFTPAQRARVARAVEAARAARVVEEQKSRLVVKDRRAAECELAERLLEHICEDSVIDRGAHALGVARMVMRGGRR